MNLTLQAKAVTPEPVWNLLRKGRRLATRSVQKSLSWFGLNVARHSDYYSPLPVVSELAATRSLWDKPSKLTGVSYNLAAMQDRFRSLFSRCEAEVRELPSYHECAQRGFGPGFPLIDGITLYCMIRILRPKRYLEVGSGLSTYYCSLAAKENARAGYPVEMSCIEPYPFARLSSIEGIRITPRKVQEIELEVFAELEAGDILFIDSSHALKVGSDVAYLFMEVVPSLKDGVFIHVHDVSFPYNTPYPADQCIFDRNWALFFNEAMVVQAFLSFNDRYEIYLSCPLLRHFVPGFIESVVSGFEQELANSGAFSSLWLVKRKR